MKQITRMQTVLGVAFFCLLLLAVSLFFVDLKNIGGRSISITKTPLQAEILKSEEPEVLQEPLQRNNLSNLSCENYNSRPIAVMLAGDVEARPLSGVSKADMVIEMPVVTGSITRLMALFVCENAEEIGSVRSSRHDFIPLSLGFDAIFAHWGGSHFAYDELNKGVINNLDAMINLHDAFYRKKGIYAPHNGFTSIERLKNASKKLGYRMESKFEGYKFESPSDPVSTQDVSKNLRIGYSYPYNVEYKYDPAKQSYFRSKGGRPEIDKAGGEQVEVKNVVVMRAASRQIGGGYNDVDIIGSGQASVFKHGEEIKGAWKKAGSKDVLRFFDENGEEIEFATGKIWINIVEPYTAVSYN